MDRQTLKTEIIAELTSHQPAQVMRYMRKLQGGVASLVHLQVLIALDAEGPLPMGRLAEAMDVSQASATGIVDRMAERGLVERLRDDEDRRVVRVGLTDEGRSTIGAMTAERREHLALVMDELTEEELAALLTGLRAMGRARAVIHDRLKAQHEAANPGVRFHDDVPDAARAPGAEPGSPTPTTEASR